MKRPAGSHGALSGRAGRSAGSEAEPEGHAGATAGSRPAGLRARPTRAEMHAQSRPAGSRTQSAREEVRARLLARIPSKLKKEFKRGAQDAAGDRSVACPAGTSVAFTESSKRAYSNFDFWQTFSLRGENLNAVANWLGL